MSASHRKPRAPLSNSTLDPAEQARFAKLADSWWAPEGELQGLMAYNPVRVAYIRTAAGDSLKKLRILDIGCGGGILAEALAREGAQVTGIDATPEAISAAKKHAAQSKLEIAYHVSTIERFKSPKPFDLVVASEVVEHVADPAAFLEGAAGQLRRGGIMIVTTFNRTLRSLAFGIIAAEHLLHLAPIGAHSWKKFLRPSEVAEILEPCGLEVQDVTGALYNPLTGKMRPSKTDLAVNYMLSARKD